MAQPESEALWQAFARSGRVEDYLRYCRGARAENRAVQGEMTHGGQQKAAPDDRWPGAAGISDHRGI